MPHFAKNGKLRQFFSLRHHAGEVYLCSRYEKHRLVLRIAKVLHMHKMRVGVLMGGKSIEKEVSFNSGRTVCDHLDTAVYQVVPIFQRVDGTLFILPWKFLHRGKISDFEQRLDEEATRVTWDDLKNLIDFMYIATHGRYAEDGSLQGMLTVLGIPYLGSKVFASALGMDKHMQKQFLAVSGIEVARGITVYPEEVHAFETHKKTILAKLQSAHVDLPYIVKPYKEGSSLGVSVVHTEDELYPALLAACTACPGKDQAVLVEEKIKGMEFSCITLTNYHTGELMPLPPTEIVSESDHEIFDYEQKYMPGRATKFTPPRCSDELIARIKAACVATTKALEFTTISRIDGFVADDGRIVIIDPNSLSGMAPSSFLFREAAEVNMSHTNVINHLIETELSHHSLAHMKHNPMTHTDSMSSKPKLRVAVLLGGRSNEKEISLESGRNVVYKLSPEKYEAIPLFVNKDLELFPLTHSMLVRNSTKEIEQLVTKESIIPWSSLPDIADFVFLGLHGGEGEDGTIQGALEMLDLPYNGSLVLTSALCMDKYKTGQLLKHLGFDVPTQLLVAKETWLTNPEVVIKQIEDTFVYPCIMKPHDDGCSVMVKKIRSTTDLKEGLADIFASNKTHALVEELIVGMELTVGVLGNREVQAFPPSQAVAAAGILSITEKFLPGAGENRTPAPLPASSTMFVQRTIEAIYQALDCRGYARIDCFYQSAEQSPTGKERLIFLELNSLPALTPATCLFHQAAEVNIRPMELIDRIIELGIEEHGLRTTSCETIFNSPPQTTKTKISVRPE